MNIYPQTFVTLASLSTWVLMVLIISITIVSSVKLQPLTVENYLTNLDNSFQPVSASGYRSNLDFPRKFYTNKYQF